MQLQVELVGVLAATALSRPAIVSKLPFSVARLWRQLVVAAQFCSVAAAEISIASRSWPCGTVSRLRSQDIYL